MFKKIIGPVLIVSLLWISVSAATTLYINWLVDTHLQILEEDVVAIEAVGEMRVILRRLNSAAVLTLTTPGDGTAKDVPRLAEEFRRHFRAAQATSDNEDTPEERAALAAIFDIFQAYENTIRDALESADASRDPTADVAAIRAAVETVAEKCRAYLVQKKHQIAEATAYTSRLQLLISRARMVFVVAGPALGILFGVIVARGLRTSVSQINVTLQSATSELKQAVGNVEIAPSSDLPALQQQVALVCDKIKEVVTQLDQTRRQAVQAERLAVVGQLAAGVAHEIRNPLTSVKLLVQVAAQRHQTDRLNGTHLRIIEEEISRIENIIQGLLDFAKPPPLNRIRHNLCDTVTSAIQLVEARAKHAGVTLEAKQCDKAVIVEGDPEQLRQVFVNVLLNGIDSMLHGGELRVNIHSDCKNGAYCQLEVCDSGPGVPPELLERVFDPFFTTKERGTGLGLAISRRIVQEHNGDMFVKQPGENGAVFVVELPIVAGPAETAAGDQTAGSNAGPLPENPSDAVSPGY